MKFPTKTKKSALPTDKISRTAPAKDAPANVSATSGQPASTPAAERAPEGPAPKAAEAATPQGSKAAGVILNETKPATVTAARQGGASWFIPAQKPSGFGAK